MHSALEYNLAQDEKTGMHGWVVMLVAAPNTIGGGDSGNDPLRKDRHCELDFLPDFANLEVSHIVLYAFVIVHEDWKGVESGIFRRIVGGGKRF